MAKRRKGKDDEWPRTVSFGAGKVRVAKRGNGFFALTWREMGSTRRTTKTTEKAALGWAEKKARELDAGTGNQWVARASTEALETLQKLAGDEEGAMRRLLDDVRDAKRWLKGKADLTTACRWFSEHGPIDVPPTLLTNAIARFLRLYLPPGSPHTYQSFSLELNSFVKQPKWKGRYLLELDADSLEKWCKRKVKKRSGELVFPAPHTLDNRRTIWNAFFNQCRNWKLLPENSKHAADSLEKPVIPDQGKQIFTIDQGRELLAAARKYDLEGMVRYQGRPPVELEVYLLIGGWLGLRPSEILRITWESFNWSHPAPNYCEVTVKVAQKNHSERFVPVDPRVWARLKFLFERSGAAVTDNCVTAKAMTNLSLLGRSKGIFEEWPVDVLRHSFCSYRIAVVKSRDQVADEADNSVAVLKKHYRRPLRHEDGLAWWDLLGAGE